MSSRPASAVAARTVDAPDHQGPPPLVGGVRGRHRLRRWSRAASPTRRPRSRSRIAFVVLVLRRVAAFLRPTDRRLPDRLPHPDRRHRHDAVVAVHEEHVEPGVDPLRRTTSCRSTRWRSCSASRRWPGCCAGSSTRPGGSGGAGCSAPMMVFTGFVVLGLAPRRRDGRRPPGRHLRGPAAPLHPDRVHPRHEPADDARAVPPARRSWRWSRSRSRASSRSLYYRGLPAAERRRAGEPRPSTRRRST